MLLLLIGHCGVNVSVWWMSGSKIGERGGRGDGMRMSKGGGIQVQRCVCGRKKRGGSSTTIGHDASNPRANCSQYPRIRDPRFGGFGSEWCVISSV